MASSALKRLQTAALDLPERERAELAHMLLASLDGPADPDAAAQWEDEINRRLAEFDDGKAQTFDYSSFMRKLRDQIVS